MASMNYYYSTGESKLNNPHQTLEQIIAALGGTQNPTQDNYTPYEQINVIDPTIRTIAEYLTQLGAEGYQYKYDDILANKQAVTEAAYAAQLASLNDAQRNYLSNMATNQRSVADTVRSQYAQAIQSGISKGMQNATLLSTLLGNSQTASDEATQLAQQRYQAGQDQQAQMIKDAADALTQSNSAYETLMGNIRQLYNDEIQQRAADLEYNASVADTNANYLANKYTADTNYAAGIKSNASGIYNSNQSTLGSLINAAMSAEAQDNYSNAYLEAARLAAEAQVAAANAYNRSSGGGGGAYVSYSSNGQPYTTTTTSRGTTSTANKTATATTPTSSTASRASSTPTKKTTTTATKKNVSTVHTSSAGVVHGGGSKSFATKNPGSRAEHILNQLTYR